MLYVLFTGVKKRDIDTFMKDTKKELKYWTVNWVSKQKLFICPADEFKDLKDYLLVQKGLYADVVEIDGVRCMRFLKLFSEDK